MASNTGILVHVIRSSRQLVWLFDFCFSSCKANAMWILDLLFWWVALNLAFVAIQF
jgi:hypothetical protein